MNDFNHEQTPEEVAATVLSGPNPPPEMTAAFDALAAEARKIQAQRAAAIRAEALREAADAIAAQDPATAPLVGVHARGEAVGLLRRMADETSEKPTREQLLAAVQRVRDVVHVADDEDVTDWQRGYRACSERALAALDGRPHPDTVITVDRQLTEEEYEALKTRWNREHSGGRQNHAGPITTGPSAEEQLARLHEGEEPVTDEYAEGTPGQWIWKWNRATPEQRLDMAARIKDAFARSSACFMGGHEMRLDQQQARLTRLEAEREQARRDVESSTEAARRAMEQRQEMATERYALQERGDKAEAAIAELAQAIRLTREYVGEEVLPAVEGWSWYDALRRHAPNELAGEHADQPATEEQPDA